MSKKVTTYIVAGGLAIGSYFVGKWRQRANDRDAAAATAK